MLIPGASPHCEVSAKRSGNRHVVDKGFFKPTMITVLIVHFAVMAMLRSHPGGTVVSLFPPSLSRKRFTTKANFVPPQSAQHITPEDNFVCNPPTTCLWWDIPSWSCAWLTCRSSHKRNSFQWPENLAGEQCLE